MERCTVQEIYKGSSQNERRTTSIYLFLVWLHALLTAKPPAAGQNQQHWCQQLVGCHPTVVPEGYKAVGIIYCFCKWQKKREISVYPAGLLKLKRNLIYFILLLKSNTKLQMLEGEGKWKRYCKTLWHIYYQGLFCT